MYVHVYTLTMVLLHLPWFNHDFCCKIGYTNTSKIYCIFTIIKQWLSFVMIGVLVDFLLVNTSF